MPTDLTIIYMANIMEISVESKKCLSQLLANLISTILVSRNEINVSTLHLTFYLKF